MGHQRLPMPRSIKSTRRPPSTLILNNIAHLHRLDHRKRIGGDFATRFKGVQAISPNRSPSPAPDVSTRSPKSSPVDHSPSSPMYTRKAEQFGWRDGFMLDGRRGYEKWNSTQVCDRLQLVGPTIPFGEPRHTPLLMGTRGEWFDDLDVQPVRFIPSMSPLGSGPCPPTLARISTPPIVKKAQEEELRSTTTFESPSYQYQHCIPSVPVGAPRSPLRVPYESQTRFSRSCSSLGMVKQVQDSVERSHSMLGRHTGRLPCSRKVVGDILINYYPNEINAVGLLSPKGSRNL